MQSPNHSSLLVLINYPKSLHYKIIIESLQLKSYLLFYFADVVLCCYHYILVFHQYWNHTLHSIYRIITDGLLECRQMQFNFFFFFSLRVLVEIFHLSDLLNLIIQRFQNSWSFSFRKICIDLKNNESCNNRSAFVCVCV